MRVLWLKNDNCLLEMRAAGAIVECMISIFPPLTPDFPALWLKSLCRPCECHAGRAHTAAIIRYRLPVSSRHPALFFLSSAGTHTRLRKPGISVIGNDHQISETPAWPFLTNMENTPASGSMMASCLRSEMTSDSIPRPSA